MQTVERLNEALRATFVAAYLCSLKFWRLKGSPVRV